MENCLLCGASINQIPPLGAYEHIQCMNCGEYKISFPALIQLIPDKLEPIKHLLASEVYNHNHLKKEALLIDTDLIKRITGSEKYSFLHKVYKLALHCYDITKPKYTGYKIDDINPHSCYSKNKEEFNSIIKHLKVLGILDFHLIEENYLNSKNFSMITDIEMTTSAFMEFEKGIDTKEQFIEVFMKDETKSSLNITNSFNNNENSNISQNSTGNQMISQDVITEEWITQELLKNDIKMDTIYKIRNELEELSSELNKIQIDERKITSIFQKIQAIGGQYILPAFNFLNNPVVVAIIAKLIGE